MTKTISPTFLAITLLCGLALFVPFAAFTGRQEEGAKIVGRVIERDTGQSLAAEIGVAVRDKGGVTMRRVNASEYGQFEIAGLPAGEIHLTTKLAGYAVERQSLRLSEGEARQIEFRLIRAGIVRGIVVDPAGNPLADAQVRVIYANAAMERGAIAATYQWEMGEVRSDATGSFNVEIHPEKEFIIEASHPGFSGEVSEPARFTSAESQASLKLSLSKSGSFEGEVRDENGNLVPGAQVILTEVEERPELQRFASFELLKRRERMTLSGPDGKFRFDQVNPSRKSLLITHPKYQPVRRALELASDQELPPAVMTLKNKNER